MGAATPGRGTLFLVVGPSGAGKDTLIDSARAARHDLYLPQRVVTREGGSAGEAIEAVSEADFAARDLAGGFALSWQAHGLFYGVPADIEPALARGRSVLVNVSRAVIDEARACFAPVRVIVVTARTEVLARRLAARGRETEAEIADRLARAGSGQPEGPDVRVIRNDGEIGPAAEAFLAALQPVNA